MPVSTEEHTFKRYDQELAQLRSLVMEMGGLVEDQIQRAVKALNDADLTTARDVIARDHAVNRLEIKADEQIANLIALRQPMGSDLRTVMSLTKTVTDLERIGDEAERIARMVVQTYDLSTSPPSKKLFRDVTTMAKLASALLQGSLDALARLDVEKAVEIAQENIELDSEFQSSLRRLITYMMEDPRTIGNAINVIFMVKALERIGDHAMNIAEYVIYIVKGKDVRHVSLEQLAQDALE